jgi:hypothetical protein
VLVRRGTDSPVCEPVWPNQIPQLGNAVSPRSSEDVNDSVHDGFRRDLGQRPRRRGAARPLIFHHIALPDIYPSVHHVSIELEKGVQVLARVRYLTLHRHPQSHPWLVQCIQVAFFDEAIAAICAEPFNRHLHCRAYDRVRYVLKVLQEV